MCSPVVVTYSSFPWINGAQFVAQAGFVGDEIAAVSYTLPAAAFPVKVDLIEMLFGTNNPQQQITTEWSVLVWAGNPNTGELIAEYSSDGKILPHMVLNPPANAIHLQFMVDPGDPDQIIVPPNASNTISVGFRIDEMNNPPTMSCNFHLVRHRHVARITRVQISSRRLMLATSPSRPRTGSTPLPGCGPLGR